MTFVFPQNKEGTRSPGTVSRICHCTIILLFAEDLHVKPRWCFSFSINWNNFNIYLYLFANINAFSYKTLQKKLVNVTDFSIQNKLHRDFIYQKLNTVS